MNLGDLVFHYPHGSPIDVILKKLSPEGFEPEEDFSLGIVIECKGEKSRVFSSQLNGLRWYLNSELRIY